MIVLKPYQEKAVDGLLENTYGLLKTPGARQKLVFKAPTGAGKTVTMAAYLNKLCEELPDRFDVPRQKAAFIWIAPNQLHLQSFNALKNYFAELRSIKPIQFEDITDGMIKPNEVLFLNWQSINKESNLFIRENEQDKTLVRYINGARMHDTEIILILDEAHLFAARGRAAQELMQKIYAKIEIDVSATPLFSSDYTYIIKRQEVVEAEMIKQGVILNPDLDHHLQHGKTLNQVLLEQALKKREAIAKAYSDLDININPLLLIQLPNDTQKETLDDIQVKEEVMTFLKAIGITIENNRLAVWLSNEKTNLEGIEDQQNITDVLLFKQAIALGWDCPRAAVLLIFREIKQEVFTIQTVGRILRMPQQTHYPNAILNNGYVYTNLSKDMIQIVADDMDYFIQNKAIRRRDYQPVMLNSSFINTRLNRNRLSARFRKCLYEAAEEYLGVSMLAGEFGAESATMNNIQRLQANFIETRVESIEIPIPRDVQISDEVGITVVEQMERFAKTQSELDILFRQFCRAHIGGYAKADSAPVLEMALKMFFEEYLAMDEFRATKIILYEQNKPKFIEVIDRALLKHEQLLKERAAQVSKKVDESKWDVPPEKMFNEHYDKKPADYSALEPFYEYKSASRPEKFFVEFLERNNQFIDWWYKNGDKNKEDFAVTYQSRDGSIRGFYVDFIIKLKNGKVAVFDTKTPDSDPEFVNKHNALIQYIEDQNKKGKNLMGGIIVPKGEGVWKYCDNRINNPKDTTGWISFDPSIKN